MSPTPRQPAPADSLRKRTRYEETAPTRRFSEISTQTASPLTIACTPLPRLCEGEEPGEGFAPRSHDRITYIGLFMRLRSDDVISTGTPPGVGLGQKPPRYLTAGQTMRLGITGLGVQQQRTVPAALAWSAYDQPCRQHPLDRDNLR